MPPLAAQARSPKTAARALGGVLKADKVAPSAESVLLFPGHWVSPGERLQWVPGCEEGGLLLLLPLSLARSRVPSWTC